MRTNILFFPTNFLNIILRAITRDASSHEDVFYIQRTILGGIMIFTSEFNEPFFSTKLMVVECNRLQNISSRTSINGVSSVTNLLWCSSLYSFLVFSLHKVFWMNVTEWRYSCISIRSLTIITFEPFTIIFLGLRESTNCAKDIMSTSFWMILWNITRRRQISLEI